MAKRWFPRLRAEEKIIKFGLTQPVVRENCLTMPRPTRHAVDSQTPIIRQGMMPRRVLLAHKLSGARSRSAARSPKEIASKDIQVALLPAVPVTANLELVVLFEKTVEALNQRIPGRPVAHSQVRRVHIEDGLPNALEMTCVTEVEKEDGTFARYTILYFGVVVSEKQSLRMTKITVKDEAALHDRRGEVASYLRRWVSSLSASFLAAAKL